MSLGVDWGVAATNPDVWRLYPRLSIPMLKRSRKAATTYSVWGCLAGAAYGEVADADHRDVKGVRLEDVAVVA